MSSSRSPSPATRTERRRSCYIPPGTRHSFRCGSEIGRVYNTLVPGGFDHGITDHGTTAARVDMPAPGTSAIHVWRDIVTGRPPVPWEHDVSSW
jgi:hypothetical protein